MMFCSTNKYYLTIDLNIVVFARLKIEFLRPNLPPDDEESTVYAGKTHSVYIIDTTHGVSCSVKIFPYTFAFVRKHYSEAIILDYRERERKGKNSL